MEGEKFTLEEEGGRERDAFSNIEREVVGNYKTGVAKNGINY